MRHGRRAVRGWAGFDINKHRKCEWLGSMLSSGRSSVDIGDSVAKSARFRASNSAYLSRTFSVAPSDAKKFTISWWGKRAKLSTAQGIIGTIGTNTTGFMYEAVDGLYAAYGGLQRRIGVPVFRDTTKFGHNVIVFDSTQGSEADRLVHYFNNVRQSWSVSTSVALNDTTEFLKSGSVTYVGYALSAIGAGYNDQYLADLCVVDGSALTPSSFGRTSVDTGAWVHKNPSGLTWGNNGFRLQFLTGAVASDLGTDTSGNGNTFTVTNMSVTAGATNDWLDDTPTNTFATLNPVDKDSGAAISNGALNMTGTASAHGVYGTMAVPSSGKWYFAAEALASSDASNGLYLGLGSPTRIPGAGAAAAGSYILYGSSSFVRYTNGSTGGAPSGLFQSGRDYYIAVDVPAQKAWVGYYNSGFTWFDSSGGTTGDPVAGTNPTWSGVDWTHYKPFVACDSPGGSRSWAVNFGQRSLQALTGFSALCTANLPTPSFLKGSNGFSAIADSGTNLPTALAAARSGWSAYLDIFIRRDAAAGNQWVFSDDASNAIDASSSAAKAAFSALTGAGSYIGYTLRIGSAYGTYTGTVAHTSGAANTITHNLGLSRFLIIVKRTDAAGDWYAYHSDCSSGKLFYFNIAGAEFADSSIASVGSNSFQIGSGLPTGTYRYLVVGEVSGFSRVTSWPGNGLADGPVMLCNHAPKALWIQGITDARFSFFYDTARNSYNAANYHSMPQRNSVTEASSGRDIDFVSNGIKARSGDAEMNGGGRTYVAVTFGGTPFKYSNAR